MSIVTTTCSPDKRAQSGIVAKYMDQKNDIAEIILNSSKKMIECLPIKDDGGASLKKVISATYTSLISIDFNQKRIHVGQHTFNSDDSRFVEILRRIEKNIIECADEKNIPRIELSIVFPILQMDNQYIK